MSGWIKFVHATAFAEERGQALLDADECAKLRGDPGLCDEIDNHGTPYQSQWLASVLSSIGADEGASE